MFSTDDLTLMQTDLNVSLPDSGTIQAPTYASDGQGGQTATFTASGTADCRVSPVVRLPTEGISADTVVAVDRWVITFPSGTTINAKDRVQSGGRTYEVIGESTGRSYELCVRVDCVEAT